MEEWRKSTSLKIYGWTTDNSGLLSRPGREQHFSREVIFSLLSSSAFFLLKYALVFAARCSEIVDLFLCLPQDFHLLWIESPRAPQEGVLLLLALLSGEARGGYRNTRQLSAPPDSSEAEASPFMTGPHTWPWANPQSLLLNYHLSQSEIIFQAQTENEFSACQSSQ